MRSRMLGAALLSTLVVSWTPCTAAGEEAQELLEKVRKKYETIRDAEVTFTERTRFPQSTLEAHTQGKLWLKKEHKYRIETGDQTIVTDGETVWSYSPSSRQVLIDRFRPADRAFAPERILGGGTEEYAATIRGREKAGSAECIVLRLVPRSEGTLVKSLRLWVDPSAALVRRAEVTDANGKETTYTVSEISLNPGLSDSRFVMQIPEGAEVVDMR